MRSGDEHLQAWLSAYLGGDEDVQWQLTNVRSGVVREADGTEEATRPPRNYGAVAAVTDRRTLFIVGGGAEDGRDEVASVPHFEVAGATVDQDRIATRLVLTTATGATWRFTARESDALDSAVAYVREHMGGTDHVETAFETAREYREAAEETDDVSTAASHYDEAVEAYQRAVRLGTAPGVEYDADTEDVREEVLETVEDAVETHLQWAREARSRGNWEYQAGDRTTAYDHLSNALDAFDRALALARECPPGDPDAIEAERDDLLTKLESLEIRAAVANAGEN